MIKRNCVTGLLALILLTLPGCQAVASQPTPTQPKTYTQQVLDLAKTCRTALENFAALNKTATEIEGASLAPSWRADMADTLININNSCGAFKGITPVPDQFRATHDLLIQAGDKYRLFTSTYTKAVDELNGDYMVQAVNYLVEGNSFLDEAIATFPQ